MSLEDGGRYVIFDPDGGNVVTEVDVDAGALLSVPAGSYLVRRRLPDRVYQAVVAVREGVTEAVRTSRMHPLSIGRTARKGHATERRLAVGVVAGGGVAGPLTDGTGAMPVARLRARADWPALTLRLDVRAGQGSTDNDVLTIQQRVVGADLSALRLFDLGAAGWLPHGRRHRAEP